LGLVTVDLAALAAMVAYVASHIFHVDVRHQHHRRFQ
jgi:hypothetical protein